MTMRVSGAAPHPRRPPAAAAQAKWASALPRGFQTCSEKKKISGLKTTF